MTKYFDEYNRVLGAQGKPVENPYLFSALLWILDPEYKKVVFHFEKMEIKNLSRDESLGLLVLGMKKLSWKRIFWMLKDFPSGTILDFSVYLNYRFPKVFWFLLPIIFVMCCWTQAPHKKITPFYKRWWIQLTQKYQHTVDLPDGGKRHFYTNNKVWSEHPESLDGKLLNVCRVYLLNLKRTAIELDRMGPAISTITFKYFEHDTNHPIVQASFNRNYQLIAGNSFVIFLE